MDATRATTRDMGDAGGNSKLEQVRRKLDQNIEQRCSDKKKGAGQKCKRCPLVQHGPDEARKISRGILSRRAVRLEPDRKPNNTSRRAGSLSGVGALGQLLSSDRRTTPANHRTNHRTNHIRCRALKPPYLPAGDQQFCGPQSRQAGIVALRRALWRMKRLGTYHVSCAPGAGRAGRERWQRQGPGSRSLACFRSRPSTPRDPSRVSVQTLSRRTNARNPVSHACDGQVGREPRRPRRARHSKTTSLQAAPAKSFSARPSAVITPASTASGVVCRVSPKPLQASISHQTSRHTSAHADVLASVASRPRWSTPC